MADLASRVEQLEERLTRLQQATSSSQTNPTSVPTAGVKIARTVAGPESYPTDGNTCYVQFMDGSFDRSLGQTSALYQQRSASTYMCYNISEELIPENTEIAVFNRNGYWWTYWAAPPEETP
jgi:hypothetical protein